MKYNYLNSNSYDDKYLNYLITEYENKEYKDNSIFFIEKYDVRCEDYTKFKECNYLILSIYMKIVRFFLIFISLGSLLLLISTYPFIDYILFYKKSEFNSKVNYVLLRDKDDEYFIIKLVKYKEIVIFENKKLRYIQISNDRFMCLGLRLNELTKREFYYKYHSGINSSQIDELGFIYGKSTMDFKVHSLFYYILRELFDLRYIFQVLAMYLWSIQNYFIFMGIISCLTLLAILLNAIETRSSNLKIQKMCNDYYNIKVIRDNQVMIIQSCDLLPGDVYIVSIDNIHIPVDSCLINGQVIVNESFLSGESDGIIKESLIQDNSQFELNNKYSILYAGSTLIQCENDCIAVVLSTSYLTEKGSLIRSILYPKKNKKNFKAEILKYCIIMFCLFILSSIIDLTLYYKNYIVHLPFTIVISKITIIFPPFLSVLLSLLMIKSSFFLKKENITSFENKKIKAAGCVDMVIFDKTGTLTEDKFNLLGILQNTLSEKGFCFNSILNKNELSNLSKEVYDNVKESKNADLSSVEQYEKQIHNKYNISQNEAAEYLFRIQFMNRLFIECLATSHSVRLINKKLVGDPIDIESFLILNWKINNTNGSISFSYKDEKKLEEKIKYSFLYSNNQDQNKESRIIKNHYELNIIKIFPFDNFNQIHTVIVKDNSNDLLCIFSKGTPEKISSICANETLPENYNSELMNYSMKGNRIVSFAGKIIKINDDESISSYLERNVSREIYENNMIFLGFIIIENKLKDSAIPTIKTLQNANMNIVIATGDNILTSTTIAYQSNIFNQKNNLLVCEFVEIDNKEVLQFKRLTDVKMFLEREDELNDDNDICNNIHRLSLSEYSRKKSSLFSEIPIFYNELKDNDIKIYLKSYENIKFFYKYLKVNNQNNEVNSTPRIRNNTLTNAVIDKTYEVSNDFDEIKIQMKNLLTYLDNNRNMNMVTNGYTFRKILNLAQSYININDPSLKIFSDTLKVLLLKGKVYGRMSSEDKKALVLEYQKEKFHVLMCGDGTNDCSALKQANVGISLNQEHVISSSFSSNSSDLDCVIKIIKEGRYNLENYLNLFQFTILYSIIQLNITKIFSLLNIKELPNNQYFVFDFIISFNFFIFSLFFKSSDKISKKTMHNSIVTIQFLITSLLHIIIIIANQYLLSYFLYVYDELDITNCNNNKNGCKIFTSYFFLSSFQSIASFITTQRINNKGKLMKNYPFFIYFIVVFIYLTFLVFYKKDFLAIHYLKLVDYENPYFKICLLFLILIDFMLRISLEIILIRPLVRYLYNRRYESFKTEMSNNQNVYARDIYRIINKIEFD